MASFTTMLPSTAPAPATVAIAVPTPSEPGWFYETIECRPLDPAAPRPHSWPLEWTCSYQGESDWSCRGNRLRFRSSKCPWRWSFHKEGERYWNYASREEFEAQHNGNHGMVTRGAEPVDQETLDLFRARVHGGAQTGFFCHLRRRWVRCKPTTRSPSHQSWLNCKKRRGAMTGVASVKRLTS